MVRRSFPALLAAVIAPLSAFGTEPRECTGDSCLPKCQAAADALAVPATEYEKYTGSACELMGTTSGPSKPGCECQLSGGAFRALSPEMVDGTCLFYGRDHSCLYADSEFPGCDPAQADSCAAPCADLQARVEADAKKAVTATVQASACTAACHCALKIGDKCFMDSFHEPLDCSLTAEQMLDEVSPKTGTTCATAGAGTPLALAGLLALALVRRPAGVGSQRSARTR